jgi:response regulator NasT
MGKTGNILIADDDPVLRMDLRAMLEEMGYTVTGEADNGNDACILARNLKPDLAILDIMMPGTSGLEAAATIGRERLAPVLLLTAYSEAEMIDQAVQAGVSAYLVKPFRRQELEPTIALAMSRYRELVALEGERDQLQEQLETRRLVGKAKAILMERQELSEREAYRRIQAQSLAMGRTLRQIAEAVILTDEMNVMTP